jgi:hypothetical protein
MFTLIDKILICCTIIIILFGLGLGIYGLISISNQNHCCYQYKCLENKTYQLQSNGDLIYQNEGCFEQE